MSAKSVIAQKMKELGYRELGEYIEASKGQRENLRQAVISRRAEVIAQSKEIAKKVKLSLGAAFGGFLIGGGLIAVSVDLGGVFVVLGGAALFAAEYYRGSKSKLLNKSLLEFSGDGIDFYLLDYQSTDEPRIRESIDEEFYEDLYYYASEVDEVAQYFKALKAENISISPADLEAADLYYTTCTQDQDLLLTTIADVLYGANKSEQGESSEELNETDEDIDYKEAFEKLIKGL